MCVVNNQLFTFLQESDVYMWTAEYTGVGTVTFERKSGQFLLLK